MCGIIGGAGNLSLTEKSVVKDLLIMDTLRGQHSTGIATVNRKGEVKHKKCAVNAIDFLDMKSSKDLLTEFDTRLIIGHNRFATKGAITSVNAHPFKCGNITGVHNGTLRGQHLLPDHKYFEVDSENIFHSFSTIGVEDTVKKLHGAYALVWWDEEENKLNVIRNSERPLYYCSTEDNRTVFWASEAEMLEAALARNTPAIKYGDIVPFAQDYLYSFDLNLETKTSLPVKKPSVKKLEVYTPPVVNKYHHNNRRGNVRQFPKKTPTPNFLQSLGYSLDDEVPFYATGESGSTLFGKSLDEHDINIRVHTGSPDEVKKLRGHSGYFSGHIVGFKRPRGSDDGYLSITIKTLEHKEWEELGKEKKPQEGSPSSTETFIRDEKGAIVTREDFHRRFRKGCSICGNPQDYDCSDFTIIGVETLICKGCEDSPLLDDIPFN